jgi:hypothetical protein
VRILRRHFYTAYKIPHQSVCSGHKSKCHRQTVDGESRSAQRWKVSGEKQEDLAQKSRQHLDMDHESSIERRDERVGPWQSGVTGALSTSNLKCCTIFETFEGSIFYDSRHKDLRSVVRIASKTSERSFVTTATPRMTATLSCARPPMGDDSTVPAAPSIFLLTV